MTRPLDDQLVNLQRTFETRCRRAPLPTPCAQRAFRSNPDHRPDEGLGIFSDIVSSRLDNVRRMFPMFEFENHESE